ncbi:MAG: hypothetical protein MUC87_12010 [Bacteroidia bacterium]|nr:hypothetical protein [Bacteroidia bacterium]
MNIFSAPAGSEAGIAQAVAQESMRRAKNMAADAAEVSLLAIADAEDDVPLPRGFAQLPPLRRSILSFGTFVNQRRLPVFADVLHAAAVAGPSDYIVYTNADIAVMPGFYKMLAHYASKGYDAFAINRRRIPARFTGAHQLDEMYAEAGETHTGYDTLVFKTELLEKFTLGNVCIGIPFFDTVLMHNLYAHAENFRLFTGKHLTFHIGLTLVKQWGDSDQYEHNTREFKQVLKALYPHFRIEKFPGASLPFFVRHFKWLMNPTFHYPTMLRLDLSQLGRKRRKYTVFEKRSLREKWYDVVIRRINFPDEE